MHDKLIKHTEPVKEELDPQMTTQHKMGPRGPEAAHEAKNGPVLYDE